MSPFIYVRKIENPSIELLRPIIHAAFQTAHDRLGLESFMHSGIHFNAADFTSLEREGATWLGAYYKSELIGCVAVTLVGPVRGRIHKLAVLPEYRGKGLGRLLMDHAERAIFAAGARRVELVCLANDEALVRFYQHLGYRLSREKAYKTPPWRLAYLEKRMAHLVDQVGSKVHASQLALQSMEGLPSQAFELLLVYHPDEVDKPSNTGHVIQRYLPDHTKEVLWHRHTIEACMGSQSEAFETVLLYPSESADPLEDFCEKRGATDRPLRLVVLDGTWQQAQKMVLQSPVLRELPAVKLVKLPKSVYTLRKNQKSEGLCTLESVAEALSEMGFNDVKEHLMKGFYHWLDLGVQHYKG